MSVKKVLICCTIVLLSASVCSGGRPDLNPRTLRSRYRSPSWGITGLKESPCRPMGNCSTQPIGRTRAMTLSVCTQWKTVLCH